MRITTYTLWLFLFVVFNATAQQFQESDIWLADIRIKPGSVYFGSIQNIINTKGYDNQPCFIDDTTLLYTHIGDDGQADIYSYHTLRKMITKFTQTKESEYSAKPTPWGETISVVEVEQDSTQRIWGFNKQGKNGKPLIPYLDSVGYYTWLNDTCVAAFILTSPPSLQLCSSIHPYTKTIAKNIGRCLQVSAEGDLHFTLLKDSVTWLCKLERNGSTTPLIEFFEGVEDFVISHSNLIFCAKGGIIYYTDSNYQLGWRMCGNFESSGVKGIYRIALSNDQKKMALVNIQKL
jgi:hypothetical protein